MAPGDNGQFADESERESGTGNGVKQKKGVATKTGPQGREALGVQKRSLRSNAGAESGHFVT